jgi:hypothetical protein
VSCKISTTKTGYDSKKSLSAPKIRPLSAMQKMLLYHPVTGDISQPEEEEGGAK